MAFTSILEADVALGRPLKASLFDLIRTNFDDLNTRVASLELAATTHVPVTVSDTASIDFAITGQAISATVIPGGVSHNSLADVQAAASGVTHGHITEAAQTIAGAKTFLSEVIVPTATADTSAVNKLQMEVAVAAAQNRADDAWDYADRILGYHDDHVADMDNPHGVTKETIELGNVTNDLQIPMSQRGTASGVATLDANSKIPLSQIPDSVLGQVEYQGVYDASVGTFPASPLAGYFWIISVNGTLVGNQTIDVTVGDWIVFNKNGSWDKVDNTDAVSSVAGRTGNVTLTSADVGLANVDNTSDANKPVSTATQTALNLKSDATHEHTVASNKITDLKIDAGKFQFNNGTSWITVDIGGIKDLTFSSAVNNTAVTIAHGIADISTIVAQSSSVKIGTELFIQGSVVGIGVEKFSVRIDTTNIIIDPFEDLAGATVRVHLSVMQ